MQNLTLEQAYNLHLVFGRNITVKNGKIIIS